jgi:hypothetical protein
MPTKVKYKPPIWVLPIFAHVSTFALVVVVSTNLLLNHLKEPELAAGIKPELFLTRELDTAGKPLTHAAVVVSTYDGLSNFRILVNGYHLFSSGRNCVAAFQCKTNPDKAEKDAKELKEHRASGGSLFDLGRTYSLPHEVVLNHYLASGQNYIDIVSENSGTGACDLTAEIVFTTGNNQLERYVLRILPEKGTEPKRQAPLAVREVFYAGGQIAGGELIERYKTSKFERRNAVCERIRVSLQLNDTQARTLSSDSSFASFFRELQKQHVCATINEPISGCETVQ